MPRRLLVGVSVLVAGITVPALCAGAATPGPGGRGVGVRLLATPTAGAANPLLPRYIVEIAAPGTSIRRRVEIDNSTRRAAKVAIYAGAASIRRGLFGFSSGRRRNDLARWTSVSRPLVHLSPSGKTVVTVTIRVPRSASSGERYAVVWAELAAVTTGGVRLVNRVGIRLYVTVGAGGDAPAGFTIGPLHAARSAAGAPLVQAVLRSTGPRTLLITGSLRLSHGPGGINAGPFPVTLSGALSPGGSAEVRVQLGRRLPRGPWHARLRLHSGQLERSAAGVLRFPGEQAPAAPRSNRVGTRHPLLVLMLIFGVVGVIALAVLVVGERVGLLRGRSLLR
ncbi:MAG: hypothetical protein QOE97_512 [Pseudonocardiales bacterium]|nr:hypothetical protein [Pseudonocardiales bacterium]